MPALRILLVLIGILVTARADAGHITFQALLREMTDLDALAQFPSPAYTTRQFSSYDRRSTDPGQQTDENWFANGDRGQHLRVDTRNGFEEYVMMDAAGPGSVVRIWSANPDDAGIVRIYLDGAEMPEIEMPLTQLLKGDTTPFLSPIAGERGRGWNSYLPIPYAKHCKVTASKRDFYYHVNYRTYAPGARVKTFTLRQAVRQEVAIAATASRLAAPFALRIPDISVKPTTYYLGPGETFETRLPGPGAINSLELSIAGKEQAENLRGVLLEADFDSEINAIRSPVGDFFGTAQGINPYESLPCGVLANGTMYAHWVMPYREGAVLRLRNTRDERLVFKLRVQTEPHRWRKDNLYFHAKWRGERNTPTLPRQDWNILSASGRGRFVGTMMHVSNPVPAWWGEGDEKIYIDGETFPGTFGTGTEDYFGYAWCDTAVFKHAYHSQPRCDGPGNFGHTNVSRFHIIDDMPFQQDIRFDMEVLHWENTYIHQSAVAYWYAAAGATDSILAPDPALLSIPPLPEGPAVMRVEGALEAETFRTVAHTGGNVSRQLSYTWGWSGAEQLWWIDPKPGNTLTLGFPAGAAGNYGVEAVFTQAPDYATVSATINGQPAGNYDFYGPAVVPMSAVPLGTFELKHDENTLTLTITGANTLAIPRHMVGLDYLLLKQTAQK